MSKLQYSLIVICALFGMSACATPDAAVDSNLADNSPGQQRSNLTSIKSDSERQNTVILFEAAATALKQGEVEDAAFLFYAGQIRRRIDEEVFLNTKDLKALSSQRNYPPSGEAQAIAALNQVIGQAINPAIFREPTKLQRVYERLEDWQPVIDRGYEPPWPAKQAVHGGDIDEVIQEKKQAFLEPMSDTVTLMQSPVYIDAVRRVQDYNFGTKAYREQPGVKEGYEAALATIERMDREQQDK